ncbi:MAG: cellulase family glycosylhydrolase, partial [Paludibacter sp.]
MRKLSLFIFVFGVLFFNSCNEVTPVIKKTLTVTPDSLEFVIEGGIDSITISTDAREWSVVSTETWVTTSVDFGITKQKTIAVTVDKNPVKGVRTAYLKIAAPDADTATVKIIQVTRSVTGTDFPDYSNPIPADNTGMNSTALQLAKQMFMGWNLGNTLEVPGSETAWGNPKATQLLIDSVKAAGFNAIRLPCAWNSYIQDAKTYKIKDSWLARVKEVIDYCYKNNMYIILN